MLPANMLRFDCSPFGTGIVRCYTIIATVAGYNAAVSTTMRTSAKFMHTLLHPCTRPAIRHNGNDTQV